MEERHPGPETGQDRIIGLFFGRDERAIELTDRAYRPRLFRIAMNITGDRMTSEEVLNDSYLALWNRIPPERPADLGAYSAVIVRNIAVDRVRKESAAMRSGPLAELADALPDSACDEVDAAELAGLIAGFLRTQKKKARIAFIVRYFEEETLEGVAARTGMTVSAVKSSLFRTREKLREFLKKEGYEL